MKEDFGEEMAKIVGEETLMLHVENPSGRYVVSKAWNIKLDRALTAAEAITQLTKMLANTTVKRSKMKEVLAYAGRKK